MTRTRKTGLILLVAGLAAIPAAFFVTHQWLHDGVGPDDGAGMAAIIVALVVGIVFTIPCVLVGLLCFICREPTPRD